MNIKRLEPEETRSEQETSPYLSEAKGSPVEYYFKKASASGIDAEQVMKVVELANKVKTGSSIFMRKSIKDVTERDGESDLPEGCTEDHPCCN